MTNNKQQLYIKIIKVGRINTNCYIVSDEKGNTFIVDPGDEPQKIIVELSKIKNLSLTYILLTHAHYDHVLALDVLKKEFSGAEVIIGEDDVNLLRAVPVQGVYVGNILRSIKSEVVAVSNGFELPFGDENIKVIATPGHSKGSVCYQIQDIIFSGDTLFWHTCGRTDLPESNEDDLKKSLGKLFLLDENFKVYPGHGKETTIREERNFWELNSKAD